MDDFRRQIVDGAASGVECFVVTGVLIERAEAEVADLDLIVGGDEYVFWFEVAMRNGLGLTAQESPYDLTEVATHPIFWDAALRPDVIEQFSAFDPLEDEVNFGLAGEHLNQLDDIRVIDHHQYLNFLLEAFDQILAFDLLLIDDLDGKLLLGLGVGRYAHSSLNEEPYMPNAPSPSYEPKSYSPTRFVMY